MKWSLANQNFLLVKGVFQHFHDSSTVWWTDWQAHPGSYSSAWSSHFFRFLSFLLIVCPEESGLPFCRDTAGEGKGGDQWYKNSDTSTYSLKRGLDALHLLKGLLMWVSTWWSKHVHLHEDSLYWFYPLLCMLLNCSLIAIKPLHTCY